MSISARSARLLKKATGASIGRIMGALAVALVAIGCLVQSPDATAQETALERVVKRGHVIVGVRDTSPGFGFRQEDGELVGFEIDLARELAAGLFGDPTKVEFLLLQGGADRVPALVSGRVDAVISTMSAFVERARVVEFSLPYAISKSVFIVADDSPFEKNADLDGKRITGRQGADIENLILSAVESPELQMYPNNSDAFLAVRQGRADAFFFEGGAALYMTKQFPGQFRELSDEGKPVAPSYLSIAMKQGEQVWLNYVNWALTDMKLTGRLSEIHQKWFGTDTLVPSWARQPM